MNSTLRIRLAWAGSIALLLSAATGGAFAKSVEPDQSDVATLKPNGRTKTGKRKVNFLGNPIIAENW